MTDIREALSEIVWTCAPPYGSDDAIVNNILARFDVTPKGSPTEAEAKMQKSFEVISRISGWWQDAADKVLERIKTDTTEDVMLYHDAVSVLVAARSVFQIAKLHAPQEGD